jgi:hypothetical protein
MAYSRELNNIFSGDLGEIVGGGILAIIEICSINDLKKIIVEIN